LVSVFCLAPLVVDDVADDVCVDFMRPLSWVSVIEGFVLFFGGIFVLGY